MNSPRENHNGTKMGDRRSQMGSGWRVAGGGLRVTRNASLSAAVALCAMLALSGAAQAQVTIGVQNFETSPGTPTMTYTVSGTGGTAGTISGNTPASNTAPANSPYFTDGSTGYRVAGSSRTLLFSSVDGRNFANIEFSLRLASISTGTSAANGADAGDTVTIEVSPDGGTTWYQRLRVSGASNARWAYSAGTGVASNAYAANNTFSAFAPSAGGDRTSDGFSTLKVAALPAVQNLTVRVVLLNNDANETWAIDEAKITGTLTTTPTITLSTNSLNLGSTFTDSASTPVSYTVSGTNLGSTNIAITPSSSLVEVSTNNSSGFSTNAINLTPTAGVVASTTIFARIAASSAATNNFSASISHVSGSASTNLAVSGTINQAGQVPVITATNFTGQVGVAFSQTIPASGSPTNFTLVSGTLPGGLTFNSNNGTITGTPTNAVTNSITVTADNVTGTSSNATIGFDIAKGNQTITFAVLPAKVVGDAPFSISATASSGLAVSYASSSTNVATVSGNTVTIVGAGKTSITASQAGNENWNAATDATQTLLVYPSGVAYWNFNTDTPTVTPSGWTIGAVTQGNNNGTSTLLTAGSVTNAVVYTNSYGITYSGSTNAQAAARTGVINTGASGSAYFEFTVTAPISSSNLAITNFSFGYRATGTGPTAYALRSSDDNYAADVTGGTMSANSTWGLVSNTLSVLLTNGASRTFRLYGFAGTGSASANTANWRIDDLTLGIGELSLNAPSLNVVPTSLGGLSTFNGTPSTGSSYTINGSNLTNDVTVTTSGTDLQISSDNTVYTNQLTITPASGTVSNTTLYVRISAAATQGALSGAFVRHVSTGFTNDLTVAGNVYDATRGASSNSLVAWDASGQNSFGVSPWSPTVVASNLTVSSGLSRTSGVATSGSSTARGWGGVGWSQVDAATAVASNQFVSFTIAANSGYKLSLSGISKLDYRRPASGPTGGVVQVQIGSGAFNDVATLAYPSTATTGDSTTAINLSTNTNLQNIPANTQVTFRIVNFGGTNTGSGTWYIYDKDNNPNVDFEVTGSVEVQTAVAPTITSTNAFSGTVGVAFSGTVTATGDSPIVFSGTNLPGGLSVASGGAITGTPTAAGTFTNATLTATNSAGTNNQTATFTIAKGSSTISATGSTSFTYSGIPQGPDTSSATGSSGAVTYSYAGTGGTSYDPSASKPSGAGSYTVTATVAGDSNYNGASSTALAFTIAKANSTISVTGSTSFTFSGSGQGPDTSSVTGSSGAVTYSYAGTGGTSYGASASKPSAVGSYTVTATVAGDSNYDGATSSAYAFTINAATPSGSTFSGWLGSNSPSAALLLQYAYGASSSSNAVNRSNLPSVSLSSNSLVLTYFVRGEATNPNLVTPQIHTNLAEASSWGALPSSNITTVGTNTVDGVEVIQRRASVPVDGTRKFLRLKIAE
jgi:hypothetical protein